MSKIIDIDNKKTQAKLATRFITNLLELGGQLKVDPESGAIAYADSPDVPITLTHKGNNKQEETKVLAVYQYETTPKNFLMVNPFIEQITSTSAERVWFYNMTNRCHTVVFSHILKYIIESMVKASNGETLENPDILSTLSAIVGDFDAKSEKEIASIIKKIPEYEGILDDDVITESNKVLDDTNKRDFISIVRKVRDKKAYLTSFLQDDEGNFRKKFGNRVRKKTFALIENIFKSIYRISNFNVPLIEHESNSAHSPSFIAYCKVLISSWNKFIPFLHYIWDEDTVDSMISKIITLEEIMPHIEKIASSSVYARSNIDGIVHDRNGITKSESHVKRDRKQQMLDEIKRSKDIVITDEDEPTPNEKVPTTVAGYSTRDPRDVLRDNSNFRSFDDGPYRDPYDSRDRYAPRYQDRYETRYQEDRGYNPRYDDPYYDRNRQYSAPPPPRREPVGRGGYSNRDPLEVIRQQERHPSYHDDYYYPRDRYHRDYYDDRYGRNPQMSSKDKYLGRGYNPGRRFKG